MSDQVADFLEHYGVKGMKKPVPPHKLDRVYRVAAGTASLKERIQKARKTTAKAVADANKARLVAEAQAKALLENQATANDKAANGDEASSVDGEAEAKKLLGMCGATRLADLG
jgi:regulator of protease activity HflC (stomatin/prohibitin superfamily)